MQPTQVRLALAASVCLAPAAIAQEKQNWDAVAIAPNSHHVLFENAAMRILRVSVLPGEQEPIHEHQWPSVMQFDQPQPITYVVYAPSATTPTEVQRIEAPAIPAGHAEWAPPEDLHAVHNRGDKPFLALRVEFKGRLIESK
jgi:predicted metal-dependent enzyme (double-stranded beta helix superfamily)